MKWRYLALAPIGVLLTLYLGKFATSAPFSVIAVIFCAFVALITFQKPENGLLIIVFSMMLSPELQIARISNRPVTIRVDDLMIIVMFVAWLAHIAVNKEWQGFIKTPLDRILLLLLLLYVISTSSGILFGTLEPAKSFFYTLKYIEYFILYWCVVNIVSSKASFDRYLIAGLVTCIIITVFCYSIMGHTTRVYAPFDTDGGEPASLGGYYVIALSLFLALFLHLKSIKLRFFCLFFFLLMLPPFIKTLSRASYLAFGAMLITMFLLTRRTKIAFGIMLLAGALLFPLISPGLFADMKARVLETFTGSHQSQFTSVQIGKHAISDQSALERIESWHDVLNKRLFRNPATAMIGNGITGIGFVEGQFFLLLGELGILGTLAFYWLLIRIAKEGYLIYRNAVDPLPQSLALALVCSLAGLVLQSLTTNTFIIVRIMEPFWFLTGLVMILPSLKEQEAAHA
jgi:hypothetical protein